MEKYFFRFFLLFLFAIGFNTTLHSSTVGRIPGAFSKDLSGAAIYTIPIECPVGVNGMQPSLTLTYNSQSGNGLAGWGWNLTGSSCIMRTSKTNYYDGIAQEISFTKADSLVLDGQRLSLFKSWSKDSLEYRLESDPTSIVRGYNVQSWGPTYFKVFTKSGLMMTYNSYFWMYTVAPSSTGGIQAGWNLTEIEDLNGNFMEIKYNNGTIPQGFRNYVIDKIVYGGNKRNGTAGNSVLAFTYEGRSDPVYTRVSRKESLQGTRLAKIKISVANILQKEYRLNYQTGKTSRLASIELYNGSGSRQYAPLTFTYGEPGIAEEIDVTSRYGGTAKKDMMMAMDYNGDGYAEIYADNFYNLQSIQGLAGDFNGNGSADKIWFSLTGGNKLQLSISDQLAGSLFIDVLREIQEIPFVAVGSFLGSPLANLILIYDNPESVNGQYRYRYDMIRRRQSDGKIIRHNEDMFLTVPYKINSVTAFKSGSICYWDDLFLTLEHGHNIIIKNNQSHSPNFTNSGAAALVLGIEKNDPFTFGDYDGDGLLDIIYRQAPSTWRVAINLGNYVFSSKVLPYLTAGKNGFEGENDRVFMADIDNDNRMDIVIANELDTLRTFWSFYLNTGDGGFVLHHGELSPERAIYSCLGDLRGRGTVNWAYVNANKRVIIKDFGFERNRNVLTKVENPMSSPLIIKYKPQSQASFNNATISGTTLKKSIDDGYLQLKTSFMPIVSECSDGLNTITYDYGQAFVNWIHRGYMGFQYHKEYDKVNNVRAESYFQFYRSGTLYNAIFPSSTHKFIGTSTTHFFHEFHEYTLKPLGGKRFVPQLTSHWNFDASLNRGVRDSCSWDEYNNLIRQVSHAPQRRVVTTAVYSKKGAWCPNAKTSETTLETMGNDSQRRTQLYTYDSRGNLTLHKTDDGITGALLIQYVYGNNFGLPTTIRETASSQTRTSTITYSDCGRFVLQEKNPANQVATRAWDQNKGLLMSETTRLGTTSYAYDHFGNLNSTTYPNGQTETVHLQWASDGENCPIGDCKYVHTKNLQGYSPVTTWYNVYGQEIARKSVAFDNKKVYVFTQYENNKVKRVSKPTFSNAPQEDEWAETYTYNLYGRVSKILTPLGNTSYSRSSKWVDDGNAFLFVESVTTPDGQTKTSYYDSAGFLVKSETNGKAVKYTYTVGGKIRTATPEGGHVVGVYYDRNGNRARIDDPSIGTIFSVYDAWGQLIKETQRLNASVNLVTTYTYDSNGLLTKRTRGSEVTNFVYDSTSKLLKRIYNSTSEKLLAYDAFDRITQVFTRVNGIPLVSNKEYDNYGRVTKETYPSGYYILNNYDQYSNLIAVTDAASRQIWQLLSCDAQGKVLTEKKGNVLTTYRYTDRDQLDSIAAPGIVDMRYTYYPTGNLKSYTDAISNQTENYRYDTMDRLTSWTKVGGFSYPFDKTEYDSNSRISRKFDHLDSNGSCVFSYSSGRSMYSLATESNNDLPDQDVTYTNFKKVETIQQGEFEYGFSYGPDDDLLLMKRYYRGGVNSERYYAENYEQDRYGYYPSFHYIYGGSGLAGIYANGNLYSTYTDVLGSLSALGIGGRSSNRYAYDPWGKRRNPQNWEEKDNDTSTRLAFYRGYTMHEHFDEIGLINMNARLYDPHTSQFLSPDPQLQDPSNWFNYNRYSYCLNNPLKYVDPDGEFFHLIIGAAIGAVVNWVAHGAKFNAKGLGYAFVGAMAGAVGAGIGAGVSSAIAGSGFGAGFVNASATATSSFFSGAAIGGVGGLGSGFATGFGNSLVDGHSFGSALKAGGIYGLSMGVTGAIGGGIYGGIDAVRDGRTFFSGSTLEKEYLTSKDLVIPKVGQDSRTDCLPASVEAVDKSFGGNLTQENVRNFPDLTRDPKTGAFYDTEVWGGYKARTGREVVVQANESASVRNVVKALNGDGRVAFTLKSYPIDHSVVVQNVIQKTYTRPSGKIVQKIVYNIMDPAKGGYYRNISGKQVVNSFFISK